MAISVERVLPRALGLPKEATAHAPTIKTEPTLEEVIARPTTTWELFGRAIATHDVRDIEEAKKEARTEGRLKGLLVSAVLFNWERNSRE